MSFNPAGSWSPPAKEEPVEALEVSKGKRILQVACAVTYCLFSAGVVFGYAALKPVLVEEGVYRQFCSEEEVNISEGTCYEQEIRYDSSNMKRRSILLTMNALQAQRYVHYRSRSYERLRPSSRHYT